MKIPYGVSDFEKIRTEGFFYVDKTPFLPVLEESYQYIVFKTDAKPAQIEAAFAEAAAQVKQYSTDPALLPLLLGEKQLKAGMLVFIGAKKVLFRPWDSSPAVGQAAASDAKPAPTKPKRTVRKPRR